MLTGSLPFNAATPEKLARMHIETPPVPISEYRPDIPPALEQIVMKVLSKEPAARYRTADQLGRVLLNFGTAKAPPTPALNLTPEVSNDFTGQSASAVAAPIPGGTSPHRLATTRKKTPPSASDSVDDALDIDWLSVGLGLLALLAYGGLISLWISVYFAYKL
jgi:serine/threonine-protein kinase